MKKKIIAYGFGKKFEEEKEGLLKKYDIIGITGSDIEKGRALENFVVPEDLIKMDFDYIVITSSFDIEIINYLVDIIKVPINKILFDYVALQENIKFYGQFNDDAFILLLLKLLKIEIKDMTYLELGTNHPVNINNTYYFYKNGARGVLVEPNEKLHNIIKAIRKDDHLITKAVDISGVNETVFYELNVNAISTTVYELDEKIVKDDESFNVKNRTVVETININKIFKELDYVPTLLSIDIEGKDFEVLNEMNFEIYRPKIIIAELIAYGAKNNYGKEIISLLEDRGYTCIASLGDGVNGIFVENSVADYLQRELVL